MPRIISMILALVLLTGLQTYAAAAPKNPLPGPGDKCPVCGMFVARYADFLSTIVLRDGTPIFFDGPKDLFKFCLNPGKYLPKRSAKDIAATFVTDYYSLSAFDAHTAWFVTGSDVRGPMGHDLVPFSSEAAAREFMKDHRGKRIIRYSDVNAGLLRELE